MRQRGSSRDRSCGDPGTAFRPALIGYGCAIPVAPPGVSSCMEHPANEQGRVHDLDSPAVRAEETAASNDTQRRSASCIVRGRPRCRQLLVRH